MFEINLLDLFIKTFLVGISIVSWLTYLNWRNFQYYRIFRANLIPCEKPKITLDFTKCLAPVVGSEITHERITELIAKNGKVFGFFYRNDAYMVISDPDILNAILVKNFTNFRNKPSFGGESKTQKTSILRARGEAWKKHRSSLTPAFISSKLKLVNDKMNECVETFLHSLEPLERQDVDIGKEVSMLSMRVLGSAVISKSIDMDEEFFVSLRDFQFTRVSLSDLTHPLSLWNKLSDFWKKQKVIKKYLSKVLSSKKQKDKNVNGSKDILDIIMQRISITKSNRNDLGAKFFTEWELLANTQALLVPGHRAVARTLTFLFYVLASNPEVQERVFEEANDAICFADSPTYEETLKLTYLDSVLNETIRLYPALPYNVVREATKDITINGVFIPRNVIVMAPVWHIQHNEEYWENPEVFDPERFSPENKNNIRLGSFLAFGLGPRNCVGAKLAIHELKLTAAKAVLKYRFSLSSKTETPPKIALQSTGLSHKTGIYITFTKRSNISK